MKGLPNFCNRQRVLLIWNFVLWSIFCKSEVGTIMFGTAGFGYKTVLPKDFSLDFPEISGGVSRLSKRLSKLSESAFKLSSGANSFFLRLFAPSQTNPPSDQFEAVERGPQGMKDFVNTYGGAITPELLRNGELITNRICEEGAECIDAHRELNGIFDFTCDCRGKTANMAAAKSGQEAMISFYKADGRFSGEIRDSDGRTDAFGVPLPDVPLFTVLGGTFYDKNGTLLVDNAGVSAIENRAFGTPEEFLAAIAKGNALAMKIKRAEASRRFNEAAQKVRVSALERRHPHLLHAGLPLIFGL
jgi:hypothetical protein